MKLSSCVRQKYYSTTSLKNQNVTTMYIFKKKYSRKINFNGKKEVLSRDRPDRTTGGNVTSEPEFIYDTKSYLRIYASFN